MIEMELVSTTWSTMEATRSPRQLKRCNIFFSLQIVIIVWDIIHTSKVIGYDCIDRKKKVDNSWLAKLDHKE